MQCDRSKFGILICPQSPWIPRMRRRWCAKKYFTSCLYVSAVTLTPESNFADTIFNRDQVSKVHEDSSGTVCSPFVTIIRGAQRFPFVPCGLVLTAIHKDIRFRDIRSILFFLRSCFEEKQGNEFDGVHPYFNIFLGESEE